MVGEAELGRDDIALVKSPCHPLPGLISKAQSTPCEGCFQVSGDTASLVFQVFCRMIESHDVSIRPPLWEIAWASSIHRYKCVTGRIFAVRQGHGMAGIQRG